MSALPDVAPVVPVVTTAAAGSLQIKATPGQLWSVTCATGGVTAGYLMLFDATAVPADGAVTPVWVSSLIAVNTSVTQQFGNGAPAMRFNNGIIAVFSSTGQFTKTISATAFISAIAA